MGSPARHLLGALVAVTLVTLAGCGDDGGDAADDEPTTTTTPAGDGNGDGADGDGTTTTSPDDPTTTSTTAPSGPTTVVTTTPPDADLGPLRLGSSSAVSTLGLGPVHFGMPIAEAEEAAGTRLLPHPDIPAGHDCIAMVPEDGPEGVTFTVTARTVERVDIESPASNATISGAAIGTTVEELVELFGDQLEEQPTEGGVAYVFVPTDPNDADFRVVFETDGSAVTSLRSGRVPQVHPGRPCS